MFCGDTISLFLQVSGILLAMKGNKQFKTIKEPVSSDCG